MEVIFESERIQFTRLSKELIDDYLVMINDIENVAKYLTQNPVTYSEFVELEWIDAQLKSGAAIFSMLDKSSKSFIGNIELRNIKNGRAELGISITKEQQNNGYGKEAIHALINYGKKAYEIDTIYLNVFEFNTRAISVYKSCGFEIKETTNRGIYMEKSIL